MLSARPIITEFLASNDATLQDGFGRDSDWIEIRNAGDEPIDLLGYHLTDNPGLPDKWTFTTPLVLGPSAYLIVFASEDDTTDQLGYRHTNFKLNADGEYLALVAPDLSVLSQYGTSTADYPQQVVDISYGVSGLNDSDIGYLSTPTPGGHNSETIFLGPVIDRVDFTPSEPSTSEPIVVTAKIVASLAPTDSSSITLRYRVMYGDEVHLSMRDDGVDVDAVAADGVFTAQIPVSAFTAGQMVRWYVTARDTAGRTSRAPRFHDAGDSAQYSGTVISDSSITTDLPVMHWFVEDPVAAQKETGTRGSLYYRGEFYDNIQIDLHGRSTTAPTFPKKSFNFDANTGQKFKLHADFDRVSDFNLMTNYADKTYLRNALSYDVFGRAGSPSHFAFSVVVHRNGVYYGLYDLVEDGDEEFLARVALDPDGALYKVNNGFDSATEGVEKKSREYEGHGDLQQLVDSESLNSLQGEIWIYDNLNIASWINYFAVQSLIANRDYGQKNYYLYNDSNDTGLWTIIPWDVDLSFGHQWNSTEGYFDDDLIYADGFYANHGGNHLVNRLRAIPQFDAMYKRRLRTLLDEFYGLAGQSIEDSYVAERFDALMTEIGADAAIDRNHWGFPSDFAEEMPAQALARLKQEFLTRRKQHLNGLSAVPPTQSTQLNVTFGTVDFEPTSGDQREEYIALVNNEDSAVDISGWSISGAVSYTFAGGTVIPANSTYHLVADVGEFKARATGPRGGQRLFLQGNFDGNLDDVGGELSLEDSSGAVVAATTFGTPPGIKGDYNGDRLIDAGDYEFWASTFQSNSDVRADGNGNGVVDAADYVVWRKQLDGTAGAALPSGANVPYPSSMPYEGITDKGGTLLESTTVSTIPSFELHNTERDGFALSRSGPAQPTDIRATKTRSIETIPVLHVNEAGADNILSFEFRRETPHDDEFAKLAVLERLFADDIEWRIRRAAWSCVQAHGISPFRK
jgi:hypothetical protein